MQAAAPSAHTAIHTGNLSAALFAAPLPSVSHAPARRSAAARQTSLLSGTSGALVASATRVERGGDASR
eukprot:5289470-Pleurochrysis_carterae.AAC.5